MRRDTQRADLVRTRNALLLSRDLIWIVVEDANDTSPHTMRWLNETLGPSAPETFGGSAKETRNIRVVYKAVPRRPLVPDRLHRGLDQRNWALDWIREFCRREAVEGVVYFAGAREPSLPESFKRVCGLEAYASDSRLAADDDNAGPPSSPSASSRRTGARAKLRENRAKSAPDACTTARYEGPVFDGAGRLAAWLGNPEDGRRFCVDMAGIAFSSRALEAQGPGGGPRVRQLPTRRVLVWHTKTLSSWPVPVWRALCAPPRTAPRGSRRARPRDWEGDLVAPPASSGAPAPQAPGPLQLAALTGPRDSRVFRGACPPPAPDTTCAPLRPV
eukprot:tig00000241_g20905.t1